MQIEHVLHITIGQGPVRQVAAETDLGDLPLIAYPDSVEGKLLGMSVDELLKLRFGESVTVGISGKRYKFSRLEKDGAFTLRKDWA